MLNSLSLGQINIEEIWNSSSGKEDNSKYSSKSNYDENTFLLPQAIVSKFWYSPCNSELVWNGKL